MLCLQIIFYIMTTSHKNIKHLNIRQQLECNCIPNGSASSPYFLLKHRNHEYRDKQVNNKNNQESSCESIKVGYNKRSLRKAKGVPLLSPPHQRDTNPYYEYYSPHRIEKKEQTREQKFAHLREPPIRKQTPKILFNANKSRDFKIEEKIPQLVKVNSYTGIPTVRINFSPPPQTPKHFSPPSYNPQPSSPPKICFQSQKPPAAPMVSSHIRISYINMSPHKGGESILQKPQTFEDIKSQCHLNIPQFKGSESKQQSHRSNQSKSSIEAHPKRQTDDKNRLNIGSFNETSKSVIKEDIFNLKSIPYQIERSRITSKRMAGGKQVSRSKITLKKLRDNKPVLKKMEDVEEIRSLVDSNEESDECNESIVLGRLREYNSSSFQPSSTGLASHSKLGYQSTTAEQFRLKSFDLNFR